MTLPNTAISEFEALWNRAIPYEQFVSQANEHGGVGAPGRPVEIQA